jgi:hypothetical protein
MGAAERHQQELEEEEYQITETLRKVFRSMVLRGDLSKEEFDFLRYRTGVREKFTN